ncbi:MAG: hypothetical protein ABI480_07055 [Chitinophagaceae bacterium]
MKTNSQILFSAGRKLIILLLMGCTTVVAFATLGEGKGGKDRTRNFLSSKTPIKQKSFSLRSGYNFRGNQVINVQEDRYLNINTNASYQQGHTSYTIPVRKKVILNNKITFNPNAASRN